MGPGEVKAYKEASCCGDRYSGAPPFNLKGGSVPTIFYRRVFFILLGRDFRMAKHSFDRGPFGIEIISPSGAIREDMGYQDFAAIQSAHRGWRKVRDRRATKMELDREKFTSPDLV